MAANRIQLIPLTVVAFGSVGAGYATFGLPLPFPIQLIIIDSSLNADVKLSIDGTNDIGFVKGGGNLRLDAGAIFPSGNVCVPKLTQFYLKRVLAAPTSGNIALMGAYVVL